MPIEGESNGSETLPRFAVSEADLQPLRAEHRSSLVAASTTGLLFLGSAHGLGDEDGTRSVVDVVLGGGSDVERGNVDHLLANGDVSLSQEDTGVVHRLGHVLLDEHGLEASFHELVKGQTENIIELSLAFLEETESHNSSDEGITFELSSWIVLIEGEQLTSSLSESGKSQLDTPDFSLTSETELANNLELGHESIPIERLSRGLGGFLVVSIFFRHFYMLALL